MKGPTELNRPYRRGADIARTIVGLIWIAGAVFNAIWTMRHTRLYQGFVDESPIPAVRWLFSDIVMANASFWTVMLVAGELALGLLTLGRGMWARLGIAASVVWSAFLFILLPPYTLMMGPFALAVAWLLRWDYPQTALHLLRARPRRPSSNSAARPGSGGSAIA